MLGAVLCALTWPLQADRIAFDEVREALRAVELYRGEVTFAQSWRASVHPPLVPYLTSLALHLFPAVVACRLPQVLAGFLTVLLVVALGRRSGRPEVGLVAGLFLAGSPIWWAYACAVSLDLPLACVAALAAFSCTAPDRRRSDWLYLLLAVLLAILTKRQGLTLVGAGSLLALLAALPRRGLWLPLLLVVGAAAVGAMGLRSYLAGGLEVFGVVRRLDELVSTTPVILVMAVLGLVGLLVVLWRVGADGRRVLLPLALFVAPLIAAPLVSSHPAPRYFLPALPVVGLITGAAVWFWGFGLPSRARWGLSVLALLASGGVQELDLEHNYWPHQRGHRDAVRWLAAHAPADHVVMSPSGYFLQLAKVYENVDLPPVVDVDRTTCARLENALARAKSPAWVVLPLYRDVGWPPGIEAHARAMGLELRALVRRNVREVVAPAGATPWLAARDVPAVGPADGVPVLAILRAVAKPSRADLAATVAPLTLARFGDAASLRAWRQVGVEVESVAGGGAGLRFTGSPADAPYVSFATVYQLRRSESHLLVETGGLDRPDLPHLVAAQLAESGLLASDAWHHHGTLELVARGEPAALAAVQLSIGTRRRTLLRRLDEFPGEEVGDGWRRLSWDLGHVTPEELSKVEWLALSAWQGRGWGDAVRVELKEIRLR